MDADQVSLPAPVALCLATTLLLAAWALRLPPALANRFHADEALYGYWGLLVSSGADPWLAGVPMFKPPLLPYLLALAFTGLGSSELSARCVGLASGLLTVALTWALARRLYRDRTSALLAGLFVALSPFTLLFSASAFTDGPMVALGLAGCLAAARGRPGWAGLWLGLSLAAKQTGLVFVPLALLLLLPSNGLRGLWRAAAGCTAVVAVVLAWDGVRVWQGGAGFWAEGVAGYGGLRLIWPAELWPRLHAWMGWLGYLFGSPPASAMAGLGVLILCVRVLLRQAGRWDAFYDLALTAFVVVYLLAHWLLAFPVWDRYLLTVVPIAAVAAGRAVALGTRWAAACVHRKHSWQPARERALLVVLVVVLGLAQPALRASAGAVPVGGGQAAYDGIDRVAAFLRAQPKGAVVYHHWLGWHYSFYLHGAAIYPAYWPHPAWLARDLQAMGATGARFVVFPASESEGRVRQALAEVGWTLEPVLTTRGRDGQVTFTVYSLQPVRSALALRRYAGTIVSGIGNEQ